MAERGDAPRGHGPIALQATVFFGAAAAFALGITGMVGWALGIERLKSITPGLVAMKANTALCFLLTAAALDAHRRRRLHPLWAAPAGVAAVIGMLTLVEYATGVDLAIDQALFDERLPAVDTSHPGRMAPGTAVGFSLSGTAIVLLQVRRGRRLLAADAIAIGAGLAALLPLLGYLYDADALYGIQGTTRIAPHTAVGLILLAAAVICSDRGLQSSGLVAAPTAGGIAVRRVIPVTALALVALGWLQLEGERGGIYESRFGLALMVLAHITLVSGVVYAVARRLDREDLARLAAEREVWQANERLELEVAVRTAELAAANRDLKAFASTAAHDLQRPLRLMKGFTQLAVRDAGSGLPPTARHYLQRVEDEAGELGALIGDLLELARVGNAAMAVEHVDLMPLARAVFEDSSPDRVRPRLTLRPMPSCRADPRLVRELLDNLIDNASKFSAMSKAPAVEIGYTDTRGGAYYVRDNGIGFDEKDRELIFRPFARLHAPHEYEGMGMGLAIVRRIAERHGGRAWAESEEGSGSTFYFTLANGGQARDVAA